MTQGWLVTQQLTRVAPIFFPTRATVVVVGSELSGMSITVVMPPTAAALVAVSIPASKAAQASERTSVGSLRIFNPHCQCHVPGITHALAGPHLAMCQDSAKRLSAHSLRAVFKTGLRPYGQPGDGSRYRMHSMSSNSPLEAPPSQEVRPGWFMCTWVSIRPGATTRSS